MADSDSIEFTTIKEYKDFFLECNSNEKFIHCTLKNAERDFGIIVYKFYYEWEMGLVDPDIYGNPTFPDYLDERCQRLLKF